MGLIRRSIEMWGRDEGANTSLTGDWARCLLLEATLGSLVLRTLLGYRCFIRFCKSGNRSAESQNGLPVVLSSPL